MGEDTWADLDLITAVAKVLVVRRQNDLTATCTHRVSLKAVREKSCFVQDLGSECPGGRKGEGKREEERRRGGTLVLRLELFVVRMPPTDQRLEFILKTLGAPMPKAACTAGRNACRDEAMAKGSSLQ